MAGIVLDPQDVAVQCLQWEQPQDTKIIVCCGVGSEWY